METINLGAVLVALLVLVWLGYALPRIAVRREVMGYARASELAEASATARDLSAAVRTRRPSPEVTARMTTDRLLLRPTDPTSRPRFDADPGVRVDPLEEQARFRRVLGLVLAAAVLVTIALAAGAVLGMIHWALPLVALVGTAVYVVGLRRAELERRSRVRRARALSKLEAEREREEQAATARRAQERAQRTAAPAPVEVPRTSLEQTAERATAHVSTPGEWVPRPVPRPTYALRGEVEDLGTRHEAHREAVRSRSVPLESEGVEALEASDENTPVVDLGLDQVLARRRA